MYAVRHLTVRQWDLQSEDDRFSVALTRGGEPVVGVEDKEISTLQKEVMYWRKANHIHGWFVEHVQNGEDDQGEHYVSPEIIEELLDTCEKVISASELVDGQVNMGTTYDKEHPNGVVDWRPGKVIKNATVAKELLPVTEGFFFGGYEYDRYYLDEVVRTRDWCQRMLKDFEDEVPGDIFYLSWW